MAALNHAAGNGAEGNGNGDGANGEHAASELLEVERLTTALTADWLEQYAVLPIKLGDGVIVVGTWRERVEPLALDDLRLTARTACAPRAVQKEHDLRSAIRRVYAPDAVTAEGLIAGLSNGEVRGQNADEIPLDDLLHLANEAPVVRLVNLLLIEGLEARASDVHLEGYSDGLRVRYRVDGVLQAALSPPPASGRRRSSAVSRSWPSSTSPSAASRRTGAFGCVCRIARSTCASPRCRRCAAKASCCACSTKRRDASRSPNSAWRATCAYAELFREESSRGRMESCLLTGSTGSGKTTTLYAALEMLRTGKEKILTVEDPVEYELPGVPQVPVNEKVGVTFASALRALLRQDPDVILVGEIRDPETAQIARIQAALTGHPASSARSTRTTRRRR